MFVIKRSGIKENVQFDKITSRLQKLLYGGLDKTIDPAIITQKICSRMSSGITTTELDNLASQICMGMIIDNPDFGTLGARIVISNHQKNTDDDFLSVVTDLKNNKDIQGNLAPLVSEELYNIVLNNTEFLQNMIDFERDYLLDYFGFKTLERSYLLKVNEGKVKRIVERPQHLFLRVAIGIHGDDFESVKKTYDNMSLKNYTHATPTLFNAGTNHPQLSSCFEKNTLINTLNGPIPIKDIKIGEEVITHLGNVKKVVQIHKNSINNRTLYNVEINKTNKFIVTEDHNLRVFDKNSKKITWKSVNNLSSEDYVMIPKYSGHIDEHEIDVLQIVSKHKFDDMTILCNDINDINYLSATELLLKVKERGFTGCDKLSKEKLLNKLISDKIEIEKVYEQYSLEGVLLNTYKNTDDIVSKLKISKRSISRATSNGKSRHKTAGGYRWIKKEKEIRIPYIYQEINDKYIFTITKVSHSNLNNGQNVICYVKSSLLNRKIIIDEIFCKFLGIWYGDGHIINKDGKISGIGITIHKDNKNLIEFCVSMKKHFGLEHVTIHKMTTQNVIQVLYHSSLLGILFKEKYGEYFDKKRLDKDIYKYTDKLVLSFLSGLITSDGCVTENGCIKIELSNKTLINEIYSLCRIHNIDVSGVREINTNKLATTPSYSIHLTCIRDKIENLMKIYKDDRINNLKNPLKANNQHHCIEFNGFKFLKFNKKEKVLTKDLYVYTLGVEDDHSYSVEGIIAENCFLAGTEDSVEGIFETMTDCAKISKWSGGIGLHISNIRANGSYIRKTAGTSDGIVPMLKVYNDIARYINQGGGKRNGSFAVYLEPHHADVIPFLEARKNVGPEELRARDLFYALWVSDYFMECIEKNYDWYLMDPDQSYGLNEVYGDEYTELYKKYVAEGKYFKKIKARELWEHIIASQIEHGMPYISYKDHVNRKSNQKHYGTIKSSNLCVSGDTMILTKNGYFPIKSLEKQNIEVWNGKEWSKTVAKKTGENQKLLKVKFTNGLELKCTEYHKFYIENGTFEKSVPVIVEAKDLKKDMRIITFETDVVNDNDNHLKYAYTDGLHCTENNYYVPINNSIDSKIRWLEGYFDGNGCINENDGIQFSSDNLNFIREIIYLLQTLGITTQIKTLEKSYIDSIGLNKLINMGFKPKRLDVSNSRLPHHKTNMYTKIEDVIDEDIYEDTYCFNEPLEHKGIFNGIITGQCNEINEYSDKDETAVCNLGSICLPKILEYPFTDEWRNLSDSKVSVYEDSSRLLKLYSTSDCDYCKLLKALLKSCGLSYIEIDEFEAETLRLKHNPESKPFETVPQLFSVKDEDIVYLGGYSDNWKLLSPKINYNKLYELAYELTVNLNKVIDINFYPTEKTRISNMKHRPIGLGVQGLADVFMTLKIPFTSDEAREINKEIFETIYFGSMSASVYLAKRDGRYPTYEGSPLSEGKFQYNLWGLKDVDLSGRWKWGELRNDLLKYGSRNSLNIALMPTASTASIFGNVESFEAITSNLYTRNVLSGVFTMINKYLIKDLIDLEIWNQDTKDRLIYNKGSVQNLRALPKFLRDVYKTSFEIDQKQIIKMSAERGVFVCQSQSLNLFFDKPTFKELTACHFYGWKNGLKTGSYYIRTRSAISGQNFGLDPRKEKQLREEKINDVEDEGCLSCGA